MRTRLGQNMRAVGQNRAVANSAGIDVDKTRIIAMLFSTVLASWGQLIYLQNIGTMSTYGAHTQVGQFAIAALLVGGASVQKATNKNAFRHRSVPYPVYRISVSRKGTVRRSCDR